MTQNYDLVLNGAGYMLVPPPETARTSGSGSTYRLEVTPFKPAGVRTGIRDWQAAPGGDDGTRWRSDGMVPEVSGYGTVPGVVIGPAVRQLVSIGVVMSAVCVFNGALYMASANVLYRVTLSGGAFSSLALVGTVAAGNVTALWVWNGRLYLAIAAPGTTYASTDGTTIVSASGTATGYLGFGYGRANWLCQRDVTGGLRASYDGGTTWQFWQVEGAIRSVLQTGKSVLVFHAAGIDEISGSYVDTTTGGTTTTSWNGAILPLVRTVGAGTFLDYQWAADFGGRVYTWFGGTVCTVERLTITGARLVPVAGAPRGAAIAATVAGGRLWVALSAGAYELWSYDGSRWVRHYTGSGIVPGLLASLAGIATDAEVLLLQAVAGYIEGLLTQSLAQTAYPAAVGSVTCGPWDGGKPDDAKTWTEVEIVWNLPERVAGLPSGAVLVETSVNGGATWAVAGTAAITAGTGGTIRQALSGVSGETLAVRVTWTPTANATAFRLLSVMANGWVLPATPAARRWEARVRCSDKLLRRDGTVDSRTGEAMRAALLALAGTGAPVPYQDLDYDANPVTTTVRVVTLAESARRGDGTHFWESDVALTLEAIT